MNDDPVMASSVRKPHAEQESNHIRNGPLASVDIGGRAGADRCSPRRLLIPIDATDRSRWALDYALSRRSEPLHVDLLFVAEPVTSLEVLRFRTQADIAEFQNRLAQWLLEDAAQPLQRAGVTVERHFREGEVAREIVDTAEQLGADAIVMPSPHPFWFNFLTRGIARKVQQRARATPVIAVDRNGEPVDAHCAASTSR